MSIRVRVPRIGPSGGIKMSDVGLMRTIGAQIIGRIRARTESGKDVDGSSFQGLSAGYAKQKRKALGHSKADLTVSGGMLNGMQARPKPSSLEIGFSSGGRGGGGRTLIQRSRSTGAGQKAFFHNISGAGKSRVKREFFGLSDEDEDFILETVEDFVVAQLRRGR